MVHAATQCEKKNMTSEKEVTSSSKRKETKTCFRWSVLHIEQLIDCISAYKSKMTFMGLDFEADKPRMYSEVRVMMVELYAEFLGPVATTIIDSKENLS